MNESHRRDFLRAVIGGAAGLSLSTSASGRNGNGDYRHQAYRSSGADWKAMAAMLLWSFRTTAS